MKSANSIASILKLNTEIDNSIIKGTHFVDKELEELYQENSQTSSNYKNIVSNIVILLGYLATFPYIFFAFYRFTYVVLYVITALISLIALIYALIKQDRKIFFYNNHFQIFLSSNALLVKGFILLGAYSDPVNDNIEEMLRVIIYHFVSTGIYLITNIESSFFIYFFYFLSNFSLIISCHFTSNKNRFYHLEAFTSFCLFIIFFSIRKQWDYKLRVIFGEQQKFQKLFSYVFEYLDGLSGFNMNFQNKESIFYGKKTNYVLEDLVKNGFFDADENFNKKRNEKNLNMNNYNKEGNNNNPNGNLNDIQDSEHVQLFETYANDKDSLTSKFFKNLYPYKFDKIFEDPYKSEAEKEGRFFY